MSENKGEFIASVFFVVCLVAGIISHIARGYIHSFLGYFFAGVVLCLMASLMCQSWHEMKEEQK